MTDYVLWTKTGEGPWIVEESADRPELASLYFRARELVRTGERDRAAVHDGRADPNHQAPPASP